MEIARREGWHPHTGHPGAIWGSPLGGGEADMDDREVDPRWGREWRYGKPMQWPTSPHWADADVSHLLSILVARLRMGNPRINAFSGDATPGKTKVSFDQWYHEVLFIKDHYPEAVVWESIIHSLKGAVADIAKYMGPTASIGHILCKLLVIFGMVASFNILKQNFYKVSQGSYEKVPFFATRLEGTLNQIQLQWPRRMTDLKAQQHLKDNLFHGVWKHIHDSVWYLYSTPGTSYSQLMVAAQKAESKSEETWERVRARAVVTT